MKTEEKNMLPTEAYGTELTFRIPDVHSLGKLDTMKTDFSLTTKYKTADDWAVLKDKELRCFYGGLKEIPNEDGEMVVCGLFASKEECFISGQKVLVEAVRNIQQGAPICIVYRGKKSNKSTEGATMIFDVYTLK